MKIPLAFLAGAGVGALAMWLAMPKVASPAGPPPVPGETTRQDVRQNKATGDEGNAAPSKTRRPLAEDSGAKILDEDDMDSPEMREIRESMAKELAERKARRLDERMATLKTRLGLDDATAAKVRALLESSRDEEEDRVLEAAGGLQWSEPIEPGEPARKRLAMDQAITQLLNPAQAAAYGEFAAEQKENRIEVATGREMTRLQANLTLTPDQKDKVYQALNEIAAKEEEDGRQAADLDEKEMQSRQQTRLDALRALLSPEQFAEYERRSMAALRMLGELPEAGEEE